MDGVKYEWRPPVHPPIEAPYIPISTAKVDLPQATTTLAIDDARGTTTNASPATNDESARDGPTSKDNDQPPHPAAVSVE